MEGVFTQTLVSGILIGFIYALIAVGLTMIFGMMDIVNFAHGEYLMVAMYFAYWFFVLFGMDPLFSLPLVTALLFLLGSHHLLRLHQADHQRPHAFPDFRDLRHSDSSERRGPVFVECRLPHDPPDADERQCQYLRRLYRCLAAYRSSGRSNLQRPHLLVS